MEMLIKGGNEFRGFDEDFVTVNPYLGTDGVKPFVDVCKEEGKGIVVLVKTYRNRKYLHYY